MAPGAAKPKSQPVDKTKPPKAGHKRKAADGHGKPAKKTAVDPNEKAIQQLLNRHKQAKHQAQAPEKVPDAKPQKKQGRQKTQEAIGLWEELRRQDTSEERRQELVQQILGLIKGHMANVAASPTASRIMQACIKHGSPADRAAIIAELKPHFVELAQNPYGHFLVSRLLAKATRADAQDLARSFKGHVPHLLRHPNGASVIEDAYQEAYPDLRNAMAAEFYGREYTLFKGTVPASLKEVLDAADVVKRRQVLQHMSQQMIPIIEKGIVDPVLSHRLIAEYLVHAPTSALEDAVQTLAGPNLLRMAHTRQGSAAACMVLAYGTAKDRKQAVKAMQGHVKTMASDQWAQLVLMTALSRVDDTALLRKNIISDLQKHLGELLEDGHARRVLQHLIDPAATCRHLPQPAAAAMDPPPRFKAAAPLKLDAQEAEGVGAAAAAAEQAGEQVQLGQSKKDAGVRQRELLGSGKTSFAADLLAAAAKSSQQLLHSKNTGDFTCDLVRGGSSGALQEAEPDGLAALHDSIVHLASRPLPDDGEEHVLVHFYSSRTLRRLVVSSSDGAKGAVAFVEKLWSGVFDGQCQQFLGTHAEKVLAALLECGSSSVQSAARSQLQPLLGSKSVDTWLSSFKGSTAGHSADSKTAAGGNEGPASKQAGSGEEVAKQAAGSSKAANKGRKRKAAK